MTLLDNLRERWGGCLYPEIRFDRENFVERWDGEGLGRGWAISFEGFGITGTLFIGRTPPRQP